MTTRVGVVGATGRMGAEVCRAVDAAEDLDLVAAVGRSDAGRPLSELVGAGAGLTVADGLDALVDAGVDVAVELTGPDAGGENLRGLLERGIHAVVGTSGISASDLERATALAARGPARALVAPNFAIGAVLMMQFAARASRHLPDVEIVELHHDRKRDAPSGTALRTADLVADARGAVGAPVAGDEAHPGARGTTHRDVPIHSVRLPGLVAHQVVLLGGTGQTLSIRHDSIDRSSFMPGVLLACRRVASLDGLVVGLEHVLDLD